MIYDKSDIQRHEYKISKRTIIKLIDDKHHKSIQYIVARRIRLFYIWFWWSETFNYYSFDGVNTNSESFDTYEDAEKHIIWCINLHRNIRIISSITEDIKK